MPTCLQLQCINALQDFMKLCASICFSSATILWISEIHTSMTGYVSSVIVSPGGDSSHWNILDTEAPDSSCACCHLFEASSLNGCYPG